MFTKESETEQTVLLKISPGNGGLFVLYYIFQPITDDDSVAELDSIVQINNPFLEIYTTVEIFYQSGHSGAVEYFK